MSIVHPKSQWQWLLLLLLSFVLVRAFETPTETQCEHDSIPDLIKSSPVILKALGARIFTDYESYPFQDDIEITEELILKAQQRDVTDVPVRRTNDGLMLSRGGRAEMNNAASDSRSHNHFDEDDDVSLSENTVTAGGASLTDGRFNGQQWIGSESTLITLTPETIYKGASALKVRKPPDGMSNIGESSYQYEEQLNATLEPVACFDSNILKLLPTEIIAFGKLVSDQRPDVLRISINGLHRWSPQFENRIWKYLGWDDWSDFTVCSVQCGKGVQQRFRRCLLDNPMISINMNMNGNEIQEQLHQDILDVSNPSQQQSEALNQQQQQQHQQQRQQQHHHHHHQLLHSRGSSSSSSRNSGNSKSHSDSPEKDNGINISNGSYGTKSFPTTDVDGARIGGSSEGSIAASSKLKKRRKRKKAKSLSTMSCEGYNIEQRNCNTFECTDDISDLLKFYKKFLPLEELQTTSVPQQSEVLTPQVSTPTLASASVVEVSVLPQPLPTSSGSSVPVASPASASVSASTTLPNTGYVRSWKNSLNFTLMITLRLKNDSRSTSTIFSVRNTTHNLYVETAADGLRLYQERDNATEMLPVKLQLYDNRWHQVSISIQNGDFISIYVDCTWTNSFVVSKRLFSLPTDADVEIGRGFSCYLSFLPTMPECEKANASNSNAEECQQAPEWLTKDYLEKKLQIFYEDPSLELASFTACPATGKGDNYTSVMTRVSVEYKKPSDRDSKLSFLVVKSSFDGNEFAMEKIKPYRVFSTEMHFYQVTIPKINALLEEIGDSGNMYPKCVAVDYDNSAIICEDLSKRGYMLQDRIKGLDMEHVKMSLRKLAKMHATTAVLNEREPGIFQNYDRGLFNRHTNSFSPFFVGALDACGRLVSQWDEFKEYGQKLIALKPKLMEYGAQVFDPIEGHVNVLAHGDFWTNNVMFCTDEKDQPKDVIMIDFQYCAWGSPAIDLHHFFNTSLREEIRLHQQDELLQYYYNIFSETLRALHFRAKIPSLHTFLIHVAEKNFYALLSGCIIQAIMINEETEDADFNALMGEDERGLNFKNRIYQNERVQKNLKALLPRFDRMGLLDPRD